jgi:Cupin
MHSIHNFNLEAITPQAVRNGGTRTMANANNFPLLNGMSLYSLRLESGGVRESHWHPNAAELSYCLAGRALMDHLWPRVLPQAERSEGSGRCRIRTATQVWPGDQGGPVLLCRPLDINSQTDKIKKFYRCYHQGVR